MKDVIGFLAIVCISILPSVYGSLFQFHSNDQKDQPIPQRLFDRWLGALAWTLLILFVTFDQFTKPVTSNLAKNLDYSLGIVLYIQYWIILRLSQRIFKPQQVDWARPDIAESLLYQYSLERISYLSVLTLDVIAEELVFRGYFLLWLGSQTGNYLLWIVVSVILSVLSHLYQGRTLGVMWTHALFASFAIAVALTSGLMTIIALHALNNIVHTLYIWRVARKAGIPLDKAPPSPRVQLAHLAFIGLNIIIYFNVQGMLPR